MCPAAEAVAGGLAPLPYRLTGKRQETADTWTLELEPARAERMAPFEPGQFAMLYAFGAGEAPISVGASDGASGRMVHTIRAVGAVTEALCATATGQEIGARGPFGAAWPLADAEGADVVVVAGGLGLPPVRPVLERVLAERERFGTLSLLYGGRSPDDLLYRDALEEWGARPDMDVEVTVDSAGADWRGRVGVVTTLIPRARFDPGRAVAMVVGPEVMMRFTVAALRERGVPAERIHVSLERSMKCAVGVCGHCMLGPEFVCKDGPVFPYTRVERWLGVPAL
ncbi:MAG: FAD/NAD(P)-binding protein [Thermoleophilaceae bacterium]|nr:FAD/NAD(P)-binding protein [Thermoleophilaceae bacterium]